MIRDILTLYLIAAALFPLPFIIRAFLPDRPRNSLKSYRKRAMKRAGQSGVFNHDEPDGSFRSRNLG